MKINFIVKPVLDVFLYLILDQTLEDTDILYAQIDMLILNSYSFLIQYPSLTE